MQLKHNLEVQRICVRAYLLHIRQLDTEMRDIENRVTELRSRLEPMGVSFDKNGSISGVTDTMADGIIKLQELQAKWNQKVIENHDEIQYARDMCSPQYLGRHILWLHYVCRAPWSQIGRIVGYSERQARNIAIGGIPEIYELMPKQWQTISIPNAQPIEYL